MWGATDCRACRACHWLGFNSRTPCGVRHLDSLRLESYTGSFNSRTPCGVRLSDLASDANLTVFQFTHPMWGATLHSMVIWFSRTCFNSRTPCGVRHLVCCREDLIPLVSIHAPRVGCDSSRHRSRLLRPRFNSRTPCGVRRYNWTLTELPREFQFTHPVWGATLFPFVVVMFV